MKNRTLSIILSVVLIGCIGVSIYQYQTAVNLKNELSVLTNTKNELATEIENKAAELNSITSEIEEANNVISELTANVESLTASSKEIQSEIDTLQKEIAQRESDKFLADSKITATTNATTSNTENTGNTNSNPVSNDILPGENANWSGSDRDAASWFINNFQGNFDSVGHHAGGEGIHAE